MTKQKTDTETGETETETMPVPTKRLLQLARETVDDLEVYSIEGVERDDVVDCLYSGAMMDAEYMGNGEYRFYGSGSVKEVVGFRRATHWQPAEYDTDDREVGWEITMTIDEDGMAYSSGRAEVM